MKTFEKWIWLDSKLYPDSQTTIYNGFTDNKTGNYTVAEFKKEYSFGQNISEIKIRFSADTEFQLFCNDEILATGPVTPGGDFINNNLPRPQHFATEVTIHPQCEKLNFFARVKMMPVRINEYSQGHGGFMLTGHITFADGTKTVITTDKSWLARKNNSFVKPYLFDETLKQEEFSFAEEINNIWHTITAPIPPRSEITIEPENNLDFVINSNEEVQQILTFDKIYAGFITLDVETNGILDVLLECIETENVCSSEKFIFTSDTSYRGLQMHSVGKFRITIKNNSNNSAKLKVKLITTHYPVYDCVYTTTSDKKLNKVFEVCVHSLKYCRQMIHLDSPRHCEPLACTGDYYIESLMTAFSFGDMDLAQFDVKRTADLLCQQDGRMFHTTYSLIWVLMLNDIYNFTGNKKLLEDCNDALILLLERFETYIGENGLIETPPDYMFIDWLYIDGFSLHHPPKALGQTCLNMFYYGALTTAEKIFSYMSEVELSKKCNQNAELLKKSINNILYDNEKGLYFEGLNTQTLENLIGDFMPQNTDKRYYRKHSNILATYFGVCDVDTAKSILDKVMTQPELGEYQPYFAHFLLEAIYRNGLRDKYTLEVINKWKPFIEECNKGLPEGFIAPDATYSFDHSHAWAGTPAYSLPKALIGFEMLEPGFSKIKLYPSLLGLESACVNMITPYGLLSCELKEGGKPVFSIPKEIEVVYMNEN